LRVVAQTVEYKLVEDTDIQLILFDPANAPTARIVRSSSGPRETGPLLGCAKCYAVGATGAPTSLIGRFPWS
jgi:hypothetical protein